VKDVAFFSEIHETTPLAFAGFPEVAWFGLVWVEKCGKHNFGVW
jgi:uncharacterized protein YggL (DUF469 family)